MAALPQTRSTRSLEIQTGRVKENHRQIIEQILPLHPERFLDLVLEPMPTVNRRRPSCGLGLRRHHSAGLCPFHRSWLCRRLSRCFVFSRLGLPQPGHGSIRLVQAQLADSGDLVIPFPLMRVPVRTSPTNPVQHAQKNRPFHSQTKMALAQQLFENLIQFQSLPEPLKNEHRSDRQCLGVGGSLPRDQGQSVGRELTETAHQSVDRTLRLQLFDSTQSGQDALARFVVCADGLDQLQVAVGPNAF